MSKLNLEDLRDIMVTDSDALKAIFSLMDAIVTQEEKKVIDCDINTCSFSQLAIIKARAEGAKHLMMRMKAELKKLKGENSHG